MVEMTGQRKKRDFRRRKSLIRFSQLVKNTAATYIIKSDLVIFSFLLWMLAGINNIMTLRVTDEFFLSHMTRCTKIKILKNLFMSNQTYAAKKGFDVRAQ